MPEPCNDILCSRVLESEDEDTGELSRSSSGDLAKIEIECQHDAILLNRLVEYPAVRQSLQTFITQMDDVMAGFPEPLTNALGDAHVS